MRTLAAVILIATASVLLGGLLACGGVDPVDPCEGVTCSLHGVCMNVAGSAFCSCDEGYHDEGLACVADGADGDADTDADADGDADADADGDADAGPDGAADADRGDDAGRDAEFDAETVTDGSADGGPDTDAEPDADTVADGAADGGADADAEPDADTVADGAADGGADADTVGDGGCPTLLELDFDDGVFEGWEVHKWGGNTSNVSWTALDSGVRYYGGSIAGGGGSSSAVTGDPAWTDYSVEADVTWVSSLHPGSGIGLTGRYTSSGNFIFFFLSLDGRVFIFDYAPYASVATVTRDDPFVIGTTYHLRVEFEGTTVRGYIDGELVVEGTQTSSASGRAGLYGNAGAKQFDNFVVRELGCP